MCLGPPILSLSISRYLLGFRNCHRFCVLGLLFCTSPLRPAYPLSPLVSCVHLLYISGPCSGERSKGWRQTILRRTSLNTPKALQIRNFGCRSIFSEVDVGGGRVLRRRGSSGSRQLGERLTFIIPRRCLFVLASSVVDIKGHMMLNE